MSLCRAFRTGTYRALIDGDANDPAMARGGNIAPYLLDGMAHGQIGGQLMQGGVARLPTFAKAAMRAARTRNGAVV